MLDDILSAVDVQVAQWILHNAILGPLLKGKTRLLCTHNIQVTPFTVILCLCLCVCVCVCVCVCESHLNCDLPLGRLIRVYKEETLLTLQAGFVRMS